MKLFQEHVGDRVIIQFSGTGVKCDGFVVSVDGDLIKVSADPEGTRNIRYVPWPNPTVSYIEFISTKGGTIF